MTRPYPRVQVSKRFQGRGGHRIERMVDPNPYALSVTAEAPTTHKTLRDAQAAARERFGVTRWHKVVEGPTWQPLDGDCTPWEAVP